MLQNHHFPVCQVRQDPRTEAFYVAGLTQRRVASGQEALGAMAAALSWRHTRAHRLNAASSRSHCLMTFTVRIPAPRVRDRWQVDMSTWAVCNAEITLHPALQLACSSNNCSIAPSHTISICLQALRRAACLANS
jgi:hypothetical protein